MTTTDRVHEPTMFCDGGSTCPGASRWRRGAHPSLICACGHSQTLHNIETRRQPCSTCPCGAFELRAREWTERRVVREEVTS